MTGGFAARCETAARPDIEVLLEDYSASQSGPNQCWHVDVFVQIQPTTIPNPLTCSQPYTLFWGNDRHGRDLSKNTCNSCCDGSTLNTVTAPLYV